MKTIRPDARIENADWTKKRQDEDAAAVADALNKAVENFKRMRAACGVPVAPSAQQLLDGAQFVQHRGGGQYRTCAEWDAAGVFVPLAKWQALVKHLDGVDASRESQQ